MSRRLVLLALLAAGGVIASAAIAKPPAPQPGGGRPEPADPLPTSLCSSYPHPFATCSAVAVSCPSTPRAQFACKTVGVSGSASAPVRKLELQLPRRYVTVKLACKADEKMQIACRVASRTIGTASGVRVVVMRLPQTFSTVRIACGTTASKFACKLAK